jgi:superfamily II DNA or RNA helicase
LAIAASAIGKIGGGKRKATGVIDVALIQSLVRKGEVDDLVGQYGHILVDECHHPIIFMQCGPVRYRVDARAEAAKRPFEHQVRIRYTGFRMADGQGEAAAPAIQDVYRTLAADADRNEMIFNDVLAALEAGRSPVVITERTDHLEALADRLSRFARNVIVLRGGRSERQRRETMARLAAIPRSEERAIVATGRYLGEGFDDERLDTLFLTMPVAWRGTLAQYAGWLHRLHESKQDVVIYDYVDREVPVLSRMAAKRAAGYSALGYRIAGDSDLFAGAMSRP